MSQSEKGCQRPETLPSATSYTQLLLSGPRTTNHATLLPILHIQVFHLPHSAVSFKIKYTPSWSFVWTQQQAFSPLLGVLVLCIRCEKHAGDVDKIKLYLNLYNIERKNKARKSLYSSKLKLVRPRLRSSPNLISVHHFRSMIVHLSTEALLSPWHTFIRTSPWPIGGTNTWK